jgi:threonine dehydrogenase-like Zn-dependent dehydrogenase
MRALINVLGICVTFISTEPAIAQRTYGGFDCTIDCSGHAAGYQWAERNGITDEADCPLPNNSPSFQEGCVAYTQDNARADPNADDDGDVVGTRRSRSMGRR